MYNVYMKQLTLTCACGNSETFTSPTRSGLIIAIDQSAWRTEPTTDGDGHVATCPSCNGGALTHAQHAEAVFAA